jgi:hypothetical protein
LPKLHEQVEFCPPCSESNYTLTIELRDVAWPLAALAAPPHVRTYNAAGASLGLNDSGTAELTLWPRSTRRLMLLGALRHEVADAPNNASAHRCGRPDAPANHTVRVRMVVSHTPNARAAAAAPRCVHEYQTVVASGENYALHVAVPACEAEMEMVYEAAEPRPPGSDACLDPVQPETRTLKWAELVVPRATAPGGAPPELWLSAVRLLPPCLQPSAGLGGVAYSLLPRRQPEVGAEGALHLTLRRGLGAGVVVATAVTRGGGRFAFDETLWPGMYTIQVASANESALRVAAHAFSFMYNEAFVRLGVLALSQADEASSFVALRWNGTTGMERLEATLGFRFEANGAARCQVRGIAGAMNVYRGRDRGTIYYQPPISRHACTTSDSGHAGAKSRCERMWRSHSARLAAAERLPVARDSQLGAARVTRLRQRAASLVPRLRTALELEPAWWRRWRRGLRWRLPHRPRLLLWHAGWPLRALRAVGSRYWRGIMLCTRTAASWPAAAHSRVGGGDRWDAARNQVRRFHAG